MKAISMKCSQEDWDSVKSEITNLPDEIYVDDYLVTNLSNDMGFVGFTSKNRKYDYDREVYEKFDKNILFDALDIEVEKVWEGTDMQIFQYGAWFDLRSNSKYRLKPKNPELDLLKDQALKLGYKIVKL